MMSDVFIAGGGLGGLVSAILLARKGYHVVLCEKKVYPFHRVCGEYISGETIPFLTTHGLFPNSFNPPIINQFGLSSVNGNYARVHLDSGGFGISRFTYDFHLAKLAQEAGVELFTNTEVLNFQFQNELHSIETSRGTFNARVVLTAHGKRSKLDKTLGRTFMNERSPWVGVKHHIKYTHPSDLIELHNFPGGYCGISNVESGITNLCYLVHRNQLRQEGTIANLEQNILAKNPYLHKILTNANFLFQEPEVINEVNFSSKTLIENHALMIGDSAGLIPPLSGNGMAMAIHSAKIASELVHAFLKKDITRATMEKMYQHKWQKLFQNRLRAGRILQGFFGSERTSAFLVNLLTMLPPLAKQIIKSTHGKPIY